MKFIIDAQLPYVLADYFRHNGFDTIHTDDLLNKERTKDSEIREIALKENRIVVSKDSDFLDSHILRKSPRKLLWVSTGNINNKELLKLIKNNFDSIIRFFNKYSLVELDNDELRGYK